MRYLIISSCALGLLFSCYNLDSPFDPASGNYSPDQSNEITSTSISQSSSSSTTTPTAYTGTGTFYEAEDAVLSGAAITKSAWSGARGNAYVEGFLSNSTPSNAQIQWNITAPNTATKLVVRYSAGDSPLPNNLEIKIDSAPFEPIPLDSTGSWSVWTNFTKTLSLPQGPHTIVIKCSGISNPSANFDYIIVE